LDDKKERISIEIESMEKKVLTRDEKIAILDQDIVVHKINADRQNAEAEIVVHEQKIMDNQKKIEELEKKSFYKRLLKQ
jgi:uncharacterized protein YeeX (DUF496 family)